MLESGLGTAELEARGALWTAREILQQPLMLRRTHELLVTRSTEVRDFLQPLLQQDNVRVMLSGAGTSAFIGDCLAPYLANRLGLRCDAVATTDIVVNPTACFSWRGPTLLVSFARSGNSPESLAAFELADRLADVHHLVITCNPAGSLAQRASASRNALLLLLPEETHDRSFAMTSSFSCMTYAALNALRGLEPARATLDAVVAATAHVLEQEAARMRGLADASVERVAYLGSHVLRGLARESALKLLELTDGTCVAISDAPLGFRHGPKTIVNDRTLALVFVSNDPCTRRYDLDLVAELGRDGVAARVVAVTAQGMDDLPGVEIVRVPHLAAADDVDLVFPFVALSQTIAFHASLARRLAPDSPNRAGTVNRVVQGVRIYGFG
jgi:tagatose-6-phosphate ketose/aldose isomerase